MYTSDLSSNACKLLMDYYANTTDIHTFLKLSHPSTRRFDNVIICVHTHTRTDRHFINYNPSNVIQRSTYVRGSCFSHGTRNSIIFIRVGLEFYYGLPRPWYETNEKTNNLTPRQTPHAICPASAPCHRGTCPASVVDDSLCYCIPIYIHDTVK